MNGESFISPIVDLFREILYDILGLFFPGASLLLILKDCPFQGVHKLVGLLGGFDNGIHIALFVGASYVTGYAIQGFAGRFWGKIVVPVVCGRRTKDEGMQGISPAFLQVAKDLNKSELVRRFREQAAAYCEIEDASKLSLNEVQNLAYSIAYERADNAFTFSFRADLANGLFFVFSIGVIVTLFEYWNLNFKLWLGTVLLYSLLAVGFAFRAWTYYSIRGRIIYSIGLAALAEYRRQDAHRQDVTK
ncbi:MAG: hypothetical protein DMF72_01315 [Acidobacteria bacterium]|nr:MAG: hypothetical protein DMF72_01315 [Acidobacteriota bacterium]